MMRFTVVVFLASLRVSTSSGFAWAPATTTVARRRRDSAATDTCKAEGAGRGIFVSLSSSNSATTEQDNAAAQASMRTATTSDEESMTLLTRTGADRQAWEATYTNCPVEIPPTVLELDGLPADFPAGTYYRNGHACFQARDGSVVQHMFDGDGMVVGLSFQEGNNSNSRSVVFRNRFVQTEGFRKDQELQTFSKPGVFGTKVAGGKQWWKNLFRTDFKNVANTHVLYAANDRLYALWEAGWPYRLDARTLENDYRNEPKGHDLDGLLKDGDSFAAHYRVDPRTGNIVNFGAKLLPLTQQFKINLFEFASSTMKPVRNDEMSVIYDGVGLAHDMALTENWCIFALPPANLDNEKALQALLGQAAFAGVIGFDKDATESNIILIPRSQHLAPGTARNMGIGQDERIKIVPVPWHFSFHYSNAFEDANGNVILDSVLSEDAELGISNDEGPVWEAIDLDNLSPGKYVRFTLDPSTCSMVGEPKVLAERNNEFPVVPSQLISRPHRYAYTVATHQELQLENGRGAGIHGAFMKVDTNAPENNEVYSFLPYEFVQEPMFVPKVGADVRQPEQEDKGYLVSYVANGRDLTTDLVILDCEGRGSFEKGPIIRMRLPTFVPPGLHGTFVEGLTFDDSTTKEAKDRPPA